MTILTILLDTLVSITDYTPQVNYAILPVVLGAIISAVAALGGSIYSGIMSSKANKEAKAEADKLAAKQDAMYKKQQAEAEMLKATEGNFMETAAGKGMVTEMKEQYDDAIKQSTANGLKREFTDEAKQAGVQSANKQLTDNMRGLAGMGTNYRLGILGMVNSLKNAAYGQKWQGDANLANVYMGMAKLKNESALNMGRNIANTGKAFGDVLGSADSWDDFKLKKNAGDTSSSTDAAVTNNLMSAGKNVIGGMDNSKLSGQDYKDIAKNGYTSEKLLEDIARIQNQNNWNNPNYQWLKPPKLKIQQ